MSTAAQNRVASESTNVSIAIDANASKLSQDQLSAWYAFAGECLRFASASSDDGTGPDLLRQLAGWRNTLTELGITVPGTDWNNVPPVTPTPGPSLWEQASGALAGPVGLGLLLWYLVSRRR